MNSNTPNIAANGSLSPTNLRECRSIGMLKSSYDPYQATCPSRTVLDHIANKWSLLILGACSVTPMRYSQIAKRINGISPKMLSRSLRSLERDGLLNRTVFPEVPPKVVYRLTQAGRELSPILESLEAWIRENSAMILLAHQQYDRAHRNALEPIRDLPTEYPEEEPS